MTEQDNVPELEFYVGESNPDAGRTPTVDEVVDAVKRQTGEQAEVLTMMVGPPGYGSAMCGVVMFWNTEPEVPTHPVSVANLNTLADGKVTVGNGEWDLTPEDARDEFTRKVSTLARYAAHSGGL